MVYIKEEMMTRINVIPVEELSDQHLLAEYRELPRALKQDINIENASDRYTLGPGHVKWARRHWDFTYNRFKQICDELLYRGFRPSFSAEKLIPLFRELTWTVKDGSYNVSCVDISLNRSRILERYSTNPGFYRWTKRRKPNWVK